MGKYKQYTPEFKMKVALEAAQDTNGISDILDFASFYGSISLERAP